MTSFYKVFRRPPHLSSYSLWAASGSRVTVEMGRQAVEHIALFKVSRDLSEAEVAGIMTLKQIPGVLSVSCGPNITNRSLGYNYGASVPSHPSPHRHEGDASRFCTWLDVPHLS
eukprot:scaffold205217_cov27-Tisochrysis_lutea.AAC.2